MTVFSESDEFTRKQSIDLLSSFKNNIKKDEPTIWLFKDTGMEAGTMRAMLCRYKKVGLLPEDLKLKIIELKKPAGVIIYPK